jgi:hypothetical protein
LAWVLGKLIAGIEDLQLIFETRIIFIVAFRFKLIFGRKMTDITHDGEIPALLGWMEPCLGIISACLPFLTPPIVRVKSLLSDSQLFHYLGSRTSPSRGASKDSSDVDVELNIGGKELKQSPSSDGTVGNSKKSDDSIVLPPNVRELDTSALPAGNYGTEWQVEGVSIETRRMHTRSP